MALKQDLDKLKTLLGTDPEKAEKIINEIREKYTSQEDIKTIDSFIRQGLTDLTSDLEDFNKDISIRAQMAEVSKIVPLSYIAKNYFGKSRYWIHQKVTGQIVNGKPVKFTPEEIKTLNFALKDISKKLSSLTIVL